MLGMIKRNIKKAPQKTKEAAYKALIRPKVEHCSSIWDPYQVINITKLEGVQRRSARYVCNQYNRRDSVSNMVKSLGWESLEQRRRNNRLVLLYKIANNFVAIPSDLYLQPTTRTSRSSNNHSFQLFHTNIDQYKYSFFLRTVIDWRVLPSAVVESSTVDAFKAVLTSV